MIKKINFRELRKNVVEIYHTTRGKNIVTFMVFILISAFFWILMALNDELQRDFRMPVKIDNIPSDVTLLNDEPLFVNISLKDKGSSLIRHRWGNKPELKFNFDDINTPGYNLAITTPQLNYAIRNVFGQATVVSMKPDSITVPFTRRPGKLVHVDVKCGEITTAPKYIISGALKALTDTVRLYSIKRIPRSLEDIETVPVNVSGLTDTTIIEVRIAAPQGMRAIPSTVKVSVPVEPLIMKKNKIKVEPINIPAGKHIVTFPSQIEIKYLVPMSHYNNDVNHISVVADYRHRSAKSAKLPLDLRNIPGEYRNVELEADSVEYLIEQH